MKERLESFKSAFGLPNRRSKATPIPGNTVLKQQNNIKIKGEKKLSKGKRKKMISNKTQHFKRE